MKDSTQYISEKARKRKSYPCNYTQKTFALTIVPKEHLIFRHGIRILGQVWEKYVTGYGQYF